MAKDLDVKLGAHLADLESASRDRLADSRALAKVGRVSAVISSGLYALKLSLKAQICRRLDLTQLPRAFQVHELEVLMILSGLSKALKDHANRAVKRNWDEILLFDGKLNDLRYLPDGSPGLPVNARTVNDADAFIARLDDPKSGVLTWLSKPALIKTVRWLRDAFQAYADDHRWARSDYRVFVRFNPDWGTAQVILAAKEFPGATPEDQWVKVMDFLDQRLKTEDSGLTQSVSLTIRSLEQVEENDVLAMNPGFVELNEQSVPDRHAVPGAVKAH